MKNLVLTLLSFALILVGPAPSAQDTPVGPGVLTKGPTADELVIADQLPSYPLKSCPISKEKLGSMGKPIDLVVDGRLVRLCCKGCIKPVRKDPAAAIAQVDAAVIAAQGPTYPIKTCPISKKKLDSKGKPIDVVVGTRLVRVCCKGCIKAVKKDPAAALAPVNEALIAAQLKTYPLTTCVVSGEALGGEEMGPPFNMLYGTRLVRLCCKMCKKGFRADPAGCVKKIDAAAKKKK